MIALSDFAREREASNLHLDEKSTMSSDINAAEFDRHRMKLTGAAVNFIKPPYNTHPKQVRDAVCMPFEESIGHRSR